MTEFTNAMKSVILRTEIMPESDCKVLARDLVSLHFYGIVKVQLLFSRHKKCHYVVIVFMSQDFAFQAWEDNYCKRLLGKRFKEGKFAQSDFFPGDVPEDAVEIPL